MVKRRTPPSGLPRAHPSTGLSARSLPPARPHRGRRRLSAILLLLPLLAVAGCGRDPGPQDPFPRGVVAAKGKVVCAPSAQWEGEAGGEGDSGEQGAPWRFRGMAEIACAVVDEPLEGEALVLDFVPDQATAEYDFDLEWNGAPLPPGWFAEEGDGAWSVTVPADALTPEGHELRLVRMPKPGDQAFPDNRFHTLAATAPGTSYTPFRPADAEHRSYLADLLLTGVAGRGREKASGFLFAGPGRWSAAVPKGDWSLDLRLENASAAPARFRVLDSAGDPVSEVELSRVEVAPGEAVRHRADLSHPGGTVTFEVEGHPDGLYLWGDPRLRPRGEGEARWRREAPPPVVLVTVDTTRKDVLGAYGSDAGATPHLDRFAEGATVYDRAVSTTSWTLPSHASMFTGLFAGRHGAGVSDNRFPPRVATLPEELRRRGYRTVGLAGGFLVSHRFGLSRGFDLFHDPDGFEARGDDLTDRAVAILEDHRGAPLFLFLNYFDPHHTYRAPEDFKRRAGVPQTRAALESETWKAIAAGDHAAWLRVVEGKEPLTAAGLAWLEAAYLAEVAFMDRELGRLFEALRRADLWDDAWIVVVADHGELLGEGGYLTHAYRLDPELVEVPLLVKRPGQTEGERSAALTSVVDLFPTLLAAAGAEVPAHPEGGLSWAGRRLDGRFLGEPGDRTRVYYQEHHNRYHVLPNEHLRVADDLYGVESLTARQLVWPEGQECARREDGGWAPSRCTPGEPTRRVEVLHALLGRPETADAGAEHLNEEDRAALSALGYL